MINPNNKEVQEPNLIGGFTAEEIEEGFRASGQQPVLFSSFENEGLNKSLEAKAVNWEHFKQTYAATSIQPDPIPNESKPIVDSVIEELLKRKQLGIERYKVALQANNGRDALRDAFEEQIDNLLYLKQYLIEKEEMAQQLETLNAIIARLSFQEKAEALKIVDSLKLFLAK